MRNTRAASLPNGRLPGRGSATMGFAGLGLKDLDRLEAMSAGMGVEHRKLLAAIDHIVGVVDVEFYFCRRPVVALAEEIDHGDADIIKRAQTYCSQCIKIYEIQ